MGDTGPNTRVRIKLGKAAASACVGDGLRPGPGVRP